MSLYNNYIFLKRNKKENLAQKQNENISGIRVKPPINFGDLMKTTFEKLEFENESNSTYIPSFGKIIGENDSIIGEFKYYNIFGNYYLNISVDCDTIEDKVNFFEDVTSRLMGKNNLFDKNFVSIISYDSVSEYYCNKLYPCLNKFERNLRKLLFNIYTLNFNMEYFKMTTGKDFQDDFEKKVKDLKEPNIPKEDRFIKLGFYSLDYNAIETLLFNKSVLKKDINEIEQLLLKDPDLKSTDPKTINRLLNTAIPKNDWERFFADKDLENFQSVFKSIRSFRNKIAHCRNISKNDYEDCLELLNKNIDLLEMAIKKTENKDFIVKAAQMQQESLIKLSNSIKKIFVNLLEPINKSVEQMNLILEPALEVSKCIKNLVSPETKENYISSIKSLLPESELEKYDLLEESNKN